MAAETEHSTEFVPASRYEDPEVWEVHLALSMGFVARDDEEARGILALLPDEDEIEAEYGDSQPRQIVVVRGSAKPQPQHPGATDFFRMPGSWRSRDQIVLLGDLEDMDPEVALIAWEAAIGAAERLNRTAEEADRG